MVAAPAARMRAGHLQPPKSMEVEELAPFEGCSKQQQQQTGLPEKISTISYALDTYSHPLVVESKTAFHALLIVPLVIWWLAVVAGIWVYEGLPKGQRIYHSMLWFDSKILRPAGPLVPFVIVILRALVHGADYVYRHGRSSSAAVARAAAAKAARGAAGKQPLVKLGSLIGWCLAIYVAMAVARVGIYLTHWFLLTNRFLEFHIVSDHIFLAASMLICLHTEIICLMSDITRAIQRWGSSTNSRASATAAGIPGLDILLTLLFVVALFLYLFTAADMFYTAKYYHFPMESFFTTVVVFVVFQLPMLMWLKWSWRFRADE